MKQIIKRIKMKYKNNLLVKIAKLRKENKYLKEKLAEEVIEKRKIIDEITIKNMKIRELSLEKNQWVMQKILDILVKGNYLKENVSIVGIHSKCIIYYRWRYGLAD